MNVEKAYTLAQLADTIEEMIEDLNEHEIDPNTLLQMKMYELVSLMRTRSLMYLHPPVEADKEGSQPANDEIPF